MLFYANAGGFLVPIRYGEELQFVSPNINIYASENPSTIYFETIERFDAVFGGLFSSTPQTFNILSGQNEQLQLNNNMPSFNVGVSANTLEIYFSGEYEISFMVRIAPVQTAGQTVALGVRQNGSFIDSTVQIATLSTTNETVLQGTVIAYLYGQIDMAFLGTGTTSFTLSDFTNATLSIRRTSVYI